MNNYYSDERYEKIIKNIKKIFPNFEASSVEDAYKHLNFRESFPEDYTDGDITAEEEIDDFIDAFRDMFFLFENLENMKQKF